MNVLIDKTFRHQSGGGLLGYMNYLTYKVGVIIIKKPPHNSNNSDSFYMAISLKKIKNFEEHDKSFFLFQHQLNVTQKILRSFKIFSGN